MISPPLNNTPLIKKHNTWGKKHICYYQFRRRHDYPLITQIYCWFDLTPS